MNRFIDHPLPEIRHRPRKSALKTGKKRGEKVTVPLMGATKNIDKLGDALTWNAAARQLGIKVHSARVISLHPSKGGMGVDAKVELRVTQPEAPEGLGWIGAVVLSLIAVGTAVFGLVKANEIIDSTTGYLSEKVGQPVGKMTSLLVTFMGAGTVYWAGSHLFKMDKTFAGLLAAGIGLYVFSATRRSA